ncbi:acyl-CoA dehydrogenase family protein [Jatrophihabitans sp. YIM 134969]
MPTHEVTNVVPPRPATNVADDDLVLQAALTAAGVTDTGRKAVAALGELAGSEQAREWGRQANRSGPELKAFEAAGNRVDEVEFHPAWHRLLEVATGHGLHGTPWASPEPDAHTVRAAGFFAWSQAEAGHGCPVSMTYSVVPALRRAPSLAARYEPGLTATAYEFGLRESTTKAGLLAGMGMTEKQGGSDVRANTTQAVPVNDHHVLTGHKWFCSAPMSDLFLVLAQAPEGLSCFLVPRVLPDGSRNRFALQRLKDKLGNRSNASSEVEFDGTVGFLVGESGRGVRTIIDMVTMTRLDCVIGSASGQRAAFSEALHHATHRRTFGARLLDQPAMREVLADLAVESAAATAVAIRLAQAVDTGESAFLRLAVAASKYWVCKRTLVTVGEALECLGGNGYVEDSVMPRLLRESPLNSIWEGSGNVIALDVLRAVRRDPASLAAVREELVTGADPALDAAIADLDTLAAGADETSARQFAGALARCLQASLLVRHHDPALATRFITTRIAAAPPAVFGDRPGPDTAGVLAAVGAG